MARDPSLAQRMLAGLSQRLHQLVGDLESSRCAPARSA